MFNRKLFKIPEGYYQKHKESVDNALKQGSLERYKDRYRFSKNSIKEYKKIIQFWRYLNSPSYRFLFKLYRFIKERFVWYFV